MKTVESKYFTQHCCLLLSTFGIKVDKIQNFKNMISKENVNVFYHLWQCKETAKKNDTWNRICEIYQKSEDILFL